MVIAHYKSGYVTANCDVCDNRLLGISGFGRGLGRYADTAQVSRIATRDGWTTTPDASTLICPTDNDAHINARTLLATKICPTCGHHQQEQ